jgi:hypothetical protein
LSPRVAKLHWIDATIDELMLEVEDGDKFFRPVLDFAGRSSIAVDSAHRRAFAGICFALWNSELYDSFCGQMDDLEIVVDRLRF